MSTANFLQGLLLLQLHCTNIPGNYLKVIEGRVIHNQVDIPLQRFEMVALTQFGWFPEGNGEWTAEIPDYD